MKHKNETQKYCFRYLGGDHTMQIGVFQWTVNDMKVQVMNKYLQLYNSVVLHILCTVVDGVDYSAPEPFLLLFSNSFKFKWRMLPSLREMFFYFIVWLNGHCGNNTCCRHMSVFVCHRRFLNLYSDRYQWRKFRKSITEEEILQCNYFL